jgi:hypothetical protein
VPLPPSCVPLFVAASLVGASRAPFPSSFAGLVLPHSSPAYDWRGRIGWFLGGSPSNLHCKVVSGIKIVLLTKETVWNGGLDWGAD